MTILRKGADDEPPKSFKDYLPGYLHIDVKDLPQMSDDNERRYLFMALDRATRRVYLDILPDESADSAKVFLEHLIDARRFDIAIILTDNGQKFMDRFCCTGQRTSTGTHSLDNACSAHNIDHRLIPPGHPQNQRHGTTFQPANRRDPQDNTLQVRPRIRGHAQTTVCHLQPPSQIPSDRRSYSCPDNALYVPMMMAHLCKIIGWNKSRRAESTRGQHLMPSVAADE